MKLSFFTLGCPNWNIDQIIACAKQHGYDGVELRCHPDGHLNPEAPNEEAATVGKKFTNAGLALSCLSGYTKFSSLSDEERGQNLATIKRNVELATLVGAPYIRTFAGRLPEGTTLEQHMPNMADCLKEAGDYAASKGVQILLETHDDWALPDNTLALFKKADSPGVALIWDIYNSWVAGANIQDSFQKLLPYIKHTHVKDGMKTGHSELKLLGEGKMPWKQLADLFKGADYQGHHSVEWEKPWHPEIEEPEVALPAAAKFLRELFG
jgi:sugar phosphate isomerase/epimerase